MMFIEVRNNLTYHDDIPDTYCRELIRADSVLHVYIVCGDETTICIEYKDRWGKNREVFEEHDSERDCNIRFGKILQILNKEAEK